MLPVGSNGSSRPGPLRQQPGLACEECRRRKLRCDRRQPQCTPCQDAGASCFVNQARTPRGPKKGHLKALVSRIATLESLIEPNRLRETLNGQGEQNTRDSPGRDSGLGHSPPVEQPSGRSSRRSSARFTRDSPPRANMSLPDPDMLELIEADLDQLYFDRVHPSAPMIHQGYYLSWSRQWDKSESHTCLQFAMWTLATSASAHLQHMRESLYHTARAKLEELDLSLTDAPSLQHAQAWLLLTHYDFRYMSYRRAWATAGRAFRIFQLARLHEVDQFGRISSTHMQRSDVWTKQEETRRTFWLAFCLDRFINLTNGGTLSLPEETIWTCLPAPELNFQHSHPIAMDVLSTAIESSGEKMYEPFAEMIILATLCWRSIAFKQLPLVNDAHQILATVQKRLALLSLPATSTELFHPMRLFANMLANASVIWLHFVLQTVDKDKHLQLAPFLSSCEIVTLSKPLILSNFLKAHTFAPMLLYISAKFLRAHVPEQERDKLDELTKALQTLQNGNNLALHYFEMLELASPVTDAWRIPSAQSFMMPVEEPATQLEPFPDLDHFGMSSH